MFVRRRASLRIGIGKGNANDRHDDSNGRLIIALSSICQLCRSRTDHEICPIIDDNAMTRRRGLTLTLDQLTRTNPLHVPLSLYHPRSVVQCYCTYMCQVNSHIYTRPDCILGGSCRLVCNFMIIWQSSSE